MPIQIFAIHPRWSPLEDRWGDYGHILLHGMSSHLPRLNGRIALERTGPFVPPITFPGFGDIVLTAATRAALEGSGLTGFSFQPVEKALIPELRWEKWNLDAEQPQEIPNSGEPEDYILGHQHSPRASEAIGDLWELCVPETATVLRRSDIAGYFWLDLNTWNGTDLFRTRGRSSVLTSERGRDWFAKNYADYVEFSEFPTS